MQPSISEILHIPMLEACLSLPCGQLCLKFEPRSRSAKICGQCFSSRRRTNVFNHQNRYRQHHRYGKETHPSKCQASLLCHILQRSTSSITVDIPNHDLHMLTYFHFFSLFSFLGVAIVLPLYIPRGNSQRACSSICSWRLPWTKSLKVNCSIGTPVRIDAIHVNAPPLSANVVMACGLLIT